MHMHVRNTTCNIVLNDNNYTIRLNKLIQSGINKQL